MKKPTLLVIAFLCLLKPAFSFAATYYISPSGNNTTGSGTYSSPWATFTKGISAMSGGDTLIAKDGTYTGVINQIQNIPAGSAENYTTIKAETDWGVTLSETGNGIYEEPIQVETNYVIIQGFKITNHTSTHCNVKNCNHVKIIRCSSDGVVSGPASSFTTTGQYILFEECYSWGSGRYPFECGGTAQYVIFRRCVCRWDYSNTNEPQACFAAYDVNHIYYQNCIAIDGKEITGGTAPFDGLKGFFTPNGANLIAYSGCIVLNMEGAGYRIETSPVTDIVLENSIAWDCKSTLPARLYPPVLFIADSGVGPLTINHCIFGASNYGSQSIYSDATNDTFKNSILANVVLNAGVYAEDDSFATSDYNDYYGNTGGRNRNGALGAHSITTNPFTNSLKYLCRIESGTPLSGHADDGGDIGATILKKIGVSGSLYGDTDWNNVTSDSLWPFPNEDVMRTDMRAFSKAAGELWSGSPAMSGNRGFCADGTTLTKYIWQYLGNSIAPDAITDLAVSNQDKTSVTITWSAPDNSLYGTVGTAISYDIRYSLVSIDESNFAAATQISNAPAPQSAGTIQSVNIGSLQSNTTYYFAMKSSDADLNTSDISNAISGKTGDGTAPAEVTDLTAVPGTSDGKVVVSWTAPGDDGVSGIAAAYDLRLSQNTINDTNWSTATQYLSEPAPKVAGAGESITLSGLTPGNTYYFALKTSDEVPNTSGLSNITSVRAYKSDEVDINAPAGITNLAAASGAHSGEVVLNWTATGDDGSTGTALTYDIRYSIGIINAYTWGSATQCSSEPEPKVAGSAERFVVTGLTPGQQYYFAVQAIDESNLTSGVSNAPQAVAYNPIGDTTPPEQINTLSASNTAGGEVTISWTAPGGDGASGTTLYYEVRSATFTVDASNFAQASLLDSIPVPNSAGFAEGAKIYNLDIGQTYYIAVKSVDGAGNVSILSNVAFVAIGADLIGPGAIADLAAIGGTNIGEVMIGWTASGNDGAIGKAKEYDIRYSTSPLTDSGWQMAVKALNTPIPAVSGTYQSATIGSLIPNKRYYFGIKASDTGSNVSGLSDIANAKAKGATPPGKIADLTGTFGSSDGSVSLSWTAPASADGDKVQEYEIRYSIDHIYEINLWRIFSETEVEWLGAREYPAQPSVVNPGDKQTFDITGLDPSQKYFFAIKSYDRDSNSSVISNVAEAIAANGDAIAPVKIDDLHAEPGNVDGEVILSWTAPGDNGTFGTAGSYLVKYSIGYIDASTWAMANALAETPAPNTAGTKEHMFVRNLMAKHHYYFAMKTIDSVGNTSEVSNCADTLSGPVMNLDMVRSFPNPWKKASGGLITISHLTDKAKVKIFNLAGELIRELEEQNGVAFWDAKNENGQEVASGIYIYFAWDAEGHEKTGKMAVLK